MSSLLFPVLTFEDLRRLQHFSNRWLSTTPSVDNENAAADLCAILLDAALLFF
jgi:hypothetical protein